MLGYTTRRIRALAVAGKIPGAFRIDEDAHWRFDRERVLAWIEDLKAETQQRAAWSASWSESLNLKRRKSKEAFEREIGFRTYAEVSAERQ